MSKEFGSTMNLHDYVSCATGAAVDAYGLTQEADTLCDTCPNLKTCRYGWLRRTSESCQLVMLLDDIHATMSLLAKGEAIARDLLGVVD